MKGKKFIIIAVTLCLGIFLGTLAPYQGKANSNVLLASVDWVNSQLSGVNSKISQLESTISSQQAEINSLKEAIENGEYDGGSEDELPSTVYVSVSSATIHSGALDSYKVVATKIKGTELSVVDSHESTSGLWYRVQVTSSLYGWINSGDVSTSEVPKPTSVKIKSDTTLHRGALSSYAVVADLKAGSTHDFISTFVNDLGEEWYNIELSNGTRGWVKAAYCEVQ
ncbi:SH3 domain-containing protein [Pseudalkalibacillus sp. R45]|uniref:SH3 domain-containing protein n=1 Tax=Pseudalkalibacillus sp. R45 TaxID=3457433 RepID=UPI003FCDF729